MKVDTVRMMTMTALMAAAMSTTAFAAIRLLSPTLNGPSTFAPLPTMTLLPSVGWRFSRAAPVPPA